MALTLGTAKSLDDITLSDVIEHPIWLWAWEAAVEGEPGQDETWQLPVIGSADVTDEMVEPIIAFRVKGTDLLGSGSYHPEDNKLFGMALWLRDRWGALTDADLEVPVVFVAIPCIYGDANVEFVCTDLSADEAERAP